MRQINYRTLDSLQPHPYNAKTHDIGVIIESIKRFGSVDPIVVDGRTDLIMSGHGRTEALGWMRKDGDTPPDGIRVDEDGSWLVPVVDGWASRTDYDAHAAMIALNRTTELGGWDQTALVTLLEQLAEYDDLDGVGYDNDDVDALRAQLAYLDNETVTRDLDDLANEYGDMTDEDTFVDVTISLPPKLASELKDRLQATSSVPALIASWLNG